MMNHSEYHIGPEVKSFCLEGGANGMKSPDWSDEPQNNGSKTSRSMSVRRTSNDRGALQHPKRFQDLLCVWTRLFLLVVSETVPDGSQRKVQVTSCGLEVFNQTTKRLTFHPWSFLCTFGKLNHTFVSNVSMMPRQILISLISASSWDTAGQEHGVWMSWRGSSGFEHSFRPIGNNVTLWGDLQGTTSDSARGCQEPNLERKPSR